MGESTALHHTSRKKIAMSECRSRNESIRSNLPHSFALCLCTPYRSSKFKSELWDFFRNFRNMKDINDCRKRARYPFPVAATTDEVIS